MTVQVGIGSLMVLKQVNMKTIRCRVRVPNRASKTTSMITISTSMYRIDQIPERQMTEPNDSKE